MKLVRIVTLRQSSLCGNRHPIAFVIGNAWQSLKPTPMMKCGQQTNQRKISHWFTPLGRKTFLSQTVAALKQQGIPFRIISTHISKCNVVYQCSHQVAVLGPPKRKKK